MAPDSHQRRKKTILRAGIIGLAVGLAIGANLKNAQPVFARLVDQVTTRSEALSNSANKEMAFCLPEFDTEAFKASGSTDIALIVGHAYGSHDTYGDGVDVQLAQFLKSSEEARLTDRLYFTGDVLHTPSQTRWENIIAAFPRHKIVIAPGNHDVGSGDNANRDIFFDNFPGLPITEAHPDYLIIAFDSTQDSETLSTDNVDYLRQQISKYPGKKKVFVLVHHVLRADGKKVANSAPSMTAQAKANRQYLDTFLTDRQGSETELVFVSGDTGAWAHSPRLDCVNQSGARFISSGIGGLKGDGVLVLAEGELFFLPLSGAAPPE